MKKGFTLIELLVVVLIIGILAAVALPQYTKAVEKSRAAEAMQVLGDIATAEQVYYMANNAFTQTASQLDLELPGFTGGTNDGTTWKIVLASITGNTTSTDPYKGKSFEAYAKRQTGTYAGQGLTIRVDPDGKVSRGCVNSATATDPKICDLVPTWASKADDGFGADVE